MVIYEINLELNPEIKDDFVSWLEDEHIDELLAQDGFYKAETFYRKTSEENGTNKDLLTIHYSVNSRKNLEDYFANESEKIRGKALEKFEGKFKIDRRILYRDRN